MKGFLNMSVIRLNLQKSIGRVLFIVEGGRNEFSLLRRVFCDVLQYEYVEKRRGRAKWFQSQNVSTSKVAVVNTEESHISYIRDSEDYLDDVFQTLIEEHEFPVDQSAIYYLFDRDPKSNVQHELLQSLLGELHDPYENADGMRGGFLLLSYPAIESYSVSCFIPDSHLMNFALGADLKEFIANTPRIQINKISEESLISAAEAMLACFRDYGLGSSLDDHSGWNERVFSHQEACYAATTKYRLLSLLSMAFLQLGILEIVDST